MSEKINELTLHPRKQRALWLDYLELCKPRVVALMLLTALVGMALAAMTTIPWQALIFGMLGIALAASAAAVVNHVIDRKIDARMHRTHKRPLPQGRVGVRHATIFASVLAILAMFILIFLVNILTAALTFLTFLGYAGIYTYYLKRMTPQNIVIGGLAGAMPPLLGWTAVTQHISAFPLLLVLIIYVWTPPHFWALAIYRDEEYKNADIPMLPVTHGIRFTKLNILLYTILLVAISTLPYLAAMTGLIYLFSCLILGIGFLYWACLLWRRDDKQIALKTFHYSILYLMLLFVALLTDHYLKL